MQLAAAKCLFERTELHFDTPALLIERLRLFGRQIAIIQNVRHCLADALRRVFIRFAASEARDGIFEVNATQSVESGIPTRSVGTSVSLSFPCRKAAYMLARKKTCVFCLFQVRQRDHTLREKVIEKLQQRFDWAINDPEQEKIRFEIA